MRRPRRASVCGTRSGPRDVHFIRTPAVGDPSPSAPRGLSAGGAGAGPRQSTSRRHRCPAAPTTSPVTGSVSRPSALAGPPAGTRRRRTQRRCRRRIVPGAPVSNLTSSVGDAAVTPTASSPAEAPGATAAKPNAVETAKPTTRRPTRASPTLAIIGTASDEPHSGGRMAARRRRFWTWPSHRQQISRAAATCWGRCPPAVRGRRRGPRMSSFPKRCGARMPTSKPASDVGLPQAPASRQTPCSVRATEPSC